MKNIQRSACFSSCLEYRYTLWRKWDSENVSKDYVMFIGLNPSTADEHIDDPTVRRCMRYAESWGYSKMCMTNLFAYRATDPSKMLNHVEPIGRRNDRALLAVSSRASLVIAAWGTMGNHLNRATHVRELILNLMCLRLTKNGHPGHPLYLPKSLKPIAYDN